MNINQHLTSAKKDSPKHAVGRPKVYASIMEKTKHDNAVGRPKLYASIKEKTKHDNALKKS